MTVGKESEREMSRADRVVRLRYSRSFWKARIITPPGISSVTGTMAKDRKVEKREYSPYSSGVSSLVKMGVKMKAAPLHKRFERVKNIDERAGTLNAFSENASERLNLLCPLPLCNFISVFNTSPFLFVPAVCKKIFLLLVSLSSEIKKQGSFSII